MESKVKRVRKSKKTLFSISFLLISSLSIIHSKNESNINITYEDKDTLEASYANGHIYVGNKDYLKNIDDINSIKILDERESVSNPNYKIYNSYKINNLFLQRSIIKMLYEHNENYPTPWDRSIDAMQCEWIAHNIGYLFNVERNRTTDVDLNNDDEEVYNPKVLLMKR